MSADDRAPDQPTNRPNQHPHQIPHRKTFPLWMVSAARALYNIYEFEAPAVWKLVQHILLYVYLSNGTNVWNLLGHWMVSPPLSPCLSVSLHLACFVNSLMSCLLTFCDIFGQRFHISLRSLFTWFASYFTIYQLRHVLCSILSIYRYLLYMISIHNLCQFSMWEHSSVCLDPAWTSWSATLMITSRSWWRSLAAKIISPIHDKKSETTTTNNNKNNSNSNNNNKKQQQP